MSAETIAEINELIAGAERMGITIDAPRATAMIAHLTLLRRWNQKLNLTAITDPQRMRVEHVLDSLSVLPFIEGSRILDVGSGGGFPGLPMAIADPERRYTLLDSRGKRVEFLRFVAGQLALTNIDTVNQRVEKYRPQEKFDTLVCRAFAPLADILSLTRTVQRPGAQLLAMKGRIADDERGTLHAAEQGLASHVEVIPLSIDGLRAERHLIRIRFDAEPTAGH